MSQLVVIYTNGEITNTSEGVTFKCDNIVVVRVDREITLERLKRVIARKLHLGPTQFISSLIYRHPISLCPTRYQSCRLQDDDDIQSMWETNSRFPTQLSSVEIYANIGITELDLNVRNPQTDDYVPSSLPYNEHTYGSSDPTSLFDSYPVEINTFDPFSTNVVQYGGPSNYDTSQPSSSRHPICPIQPPSPPGLTEDIMDDIETEEEYDAHPVEDFNLGDQDDDHDTDGEDDIVQQDEGGNTYADPVISFSRQINMEAARDHDMYVMSSNTTQELYIGQRFKDTKSMRRAVKIYSVRAHHTFTVYYSCAKYEEYRCPEYNVSCNWRLRACLRARENVWEITKYNGPHTCLSASLSQDHPKLDSDVISSFIVTMVTENPGVSVRQIIERIHSICGYTISYKKAWKGKHRAIAMAFGDWEKSYSLLPRWMAAVSQFNPGSYFEFVNKDSPVPSLDDNPTAMFHRLFWTFKPCIEALDHVKPIIQVDGTFLYGKYKGTLLVATSQDGNRNVVPLAFALVEGESEQAWSWFLFNLRRRVVKNRQGLCLISDRHPAILAAVSNPRVGWQPPFAYHVFCLRHIASNLNTHFKLKWLKKMFTEIGESHSELACKCWNTWSTMHIPYINFICLAILTGYQYQHHVVDDRLMQLRQLHGNAADWIDHIPKSKWTRAYDEGAKRWGHMTTNLAECINSVLKGVRFLPILGLVKATFYRVNHYWVERARTTHAQIMAGEVFSEDIRKKLATCIHKASSCSVRAFDRRSSAFEVQEPYDPSNYQYGRCCRVNLTDRSCDCGEFQVEKFPCAHVFAACANVSLDPTQFVNRVFRLDTIMNIYSNEFQPIGDMVNWPNPSGPTLVPNPSMMRGQGRPRTSRIRNEMDWMEGRDEQLRCGLCRQPGHNRATCASRR